MALPIKSVLGAAARAVLRPARREAPVMPLRAVLRTPVVFDLLSFAMQLRDLARVTRIRDSYAVESAHHRDVHDYNAGVTQGKLITTTRRVERYYELLAQPRRDLGRDRLLIVGPRNVHELLTAWTYGYSWPLIEAIDLYSTNPKIAVMNMEAMTFEDERFDAVAMANTLSYADDTRTALAGVARVLKPGGRFAFSATYDPDGTRWKEDRVEAGTIAAMLRELGFEICVHFAVDKTNSQGRLQTSHDFLVRKIPAGETRRDAFRL
ncbi:MAG: methyltransferase domain-containing protein [Alphaproteobacteria bacterium]|nr:methyltransferase domain-containing protein [Alphaproteobacteria bacterium]